MGIPVPALQSIGRSLARTARERVEDFLWLARTCVTWEDANRLAMDALEPIVRKDPQT